MEWTNSRAHSVARTIFWFLRIGGSLRTQTLIPTSWPSLRKASLEAWCKLQKSTRSQHREIPDINIQLKSSGFSLFNWMLIWIWNNSAFFVTYTWVEYDRCPCIPKFRLLRAYCAFSWSYLLGKYWLVEVKPCILKKIIPLFEDPISTSKISIES